MALRSDAVCTLSYTMTLSATHEALPRANPHRLQLPFDLNPKININCIRIVFSGFTSDFAQILTLIRIVNHEMDSKIPCNPLISPWSRNDFEHAK